MRGAVNGAKVRSVTVVNSSSDCVMVRLRTRQLNSPTIPSIHLQPAWHPKGPLRPDTWVKQAPICLPVEEGVAVNRERKRQVEADEFVQESFGEVMTN